MKRKIQHIGALLILSLCAALLLSGCSAKEREDGEAQAGASAGVAEISGGFQADRTATITLDAQDVEGCFDELLGWVTENGGMEYGRLLQTGEHASIDTVLAVPADRLDDFLEHAREQGKNLTVEISYTDSTADADTVRTQLRATETALDKYEALLRQAKTVDETLRIQEQISAASKQLGELNAKLRQYETQSAYSKAVVYLRDAALPEKSGKWQPMTAGDMGSKMVGGISAAMSALLVAAQWIIIVLVVLLPFLAIAAFVLLLAYLIVRRRKRSKTIRIDSAEIDENSIVQPFSGLDDEDD